jgi:hypothetical protein
MKTATSTEQSTESSCAFLNRPPLRFRKVLQNHDCQKLGHSRLGRRRQGRTYTERFLSSLMALISIFLRPMVRFSAELGLLGESNRTPPDGYGSDVGSSASGDQSCYLWDEHRFSEGYTVRGFEGSFGDSGVYAQLARVVSSLIGGMKVATA